MGSGCVSVWMSVCLCACLCVCVCVCGGCLCTKKEKRICRRRRGAYRNAFAAPGGAFLRTFQGVGVGVGVGVGEIGRASCRERV